MAGVAAGKADARRFSVRSYARVAGIQGLTLDIALFVGAVFVIASTQDGVRIVLELLLLVQNILERNAVLILKINGRRTSSA